MCGTRWGHAAARRTLGCLRRLGLLRQFHLPLDALSLDHDYVRALTTLWSRIHWSSGDGMMPPEELLAIYRFAATWPVRGTTVELGAWVGLTTSYLAAASKARRDGMVYAVDTFVSADTPLDPQNFAVAPLGSGPVARAVDNSSVTPGPVLDSLIAVVAARGLPYQVGTTNGGNDGSAWAGWGVVDIPFGWPLRYSHSPVEVIDLEDVVVLSDWIRAIVEGW